MSAWRWRSSVIVPHNSTTPLRTMTSMRATGAHASFASSVNSRVRMASSLAVVGISSRATPARPHQKFKPIGSSTLRSGLRPPEEIAFADHSDQTTVLVDHGQTADVPLQHDPDGLPYRGVRLDRYSGRRHHVLGFHGGPLFRFLET